MQNATGRDSVAAMVLPKSSTDGFDFGFNEKPFGELDVPKGPQGPAVRRSSSVPDLASFAARPNTGNMRPRPSRFLSASYSVPKFLSASHSVRNVKAYNPRPYFRSRRIKKGTIDRPELRERDPRQIWITLIPFFGFLVGCAAIALLSWTGYASVSNHKYCTVFVDEFSGGFNKTIWTKQVETGGYGYAHLKKTPPFCKVFMLIFATAMANSS